MVQFYNSTNIHTLVKPLHEEQIQPLNVPHVKIREMARYSKGTTTRIPKIRLDMENINSTACDTSIFKNSAAPYCVLNGRFL